MLNAKNPKQYTASASVGYPTIQKQYTLVATSGGITLTLPQPVGGIAGRRVRFVNASDGWVSLYSASKFLNSSHSAVVKPEDSVEVEVIKAGSSFYWSVAGGGQKTIEWKSWTPTLSWTTGTPTLDSAGVSPIAQYAMIDGVCFFTFYVNWDDGNGATALTATLPCAPADVDADIPISGWIDVNGTQTDVGAYVEQSNASEASRLLAFSNFQTATDSASGHVCVAGFYEPAGFTAFTSGGTTWGTATPASPTTVSRQKVMGLAQVWYAQFSSADNNATSAFSMEGPNIPPDRDAYGAVRFIEYADDAATWSNAMGIIDSANATAESRRVSAKDFTTGTDGEAIKLQIAAITEIAGWTSWDPDPTWGTADPASVTEKAYHTVTDDGLCFFECYLTSADGNGASSLSFELPQPVLRGSAQMPVFAVQLQNSTYSDPLAYIPANQQASGDRQKISFQNWTTAADGETVTVYVSGWYPVG